MTVTKGEKVKRGRKHKHKKKRGHRDARRNAELSDSNGRSMHNFAATAMGTDDEYRQWATHLRRRKSPESINKLYRRAERPPLTWGLSGELALDPVLQTLIRRLWTAAITRDDNSDGWDIEEEVQEWLATESGRQDTLRRAYESLAWAYALPRLASRLTREAWWNLLGGLLQQGNEAAMPNRESDPMSAQLLAGELRMVLSQQFPELKDCKSLRRTASQFVGDSLLDLLDGQGLPHGRYLPILRPLLACWTRCLWINRHVGKPAAVGNNARVQYEWLRRHVLRMTRADGSQVLVAASESSDASVYRDLIKASLSVAPDDDDRRLAKVMFSNPRFWPDDLPNTRKLPEEPAFESEWSEVAVLQPDWSPLSPQLSIRFTDRSLQAELSTLSTTLIQGDWTPRLTVDGNQLTPQSDWESVCWVSDDDVDYLELEIELDHGWKLQRQFLLAREDLFLFVADAIVGPHEAVVEYEQTVPFTSATTFQPAEESREVLITNKKRLAIVLPLALPEWKVDPRFGEIETGAGGYVLRHRAQQSRLYAPLFMDLHPQRLRKTLTWRQLTVGENLNIVPRQSAVGYRVQVGGEQWLVYRSLTAPKNRTLLGQNLATEFLVGRFLEDGTVEKLIEIEP
ncbi:MAG: hypothetical protein R3E01_14740 [Pirellulaceae bacterium]|nr:hypothetical protein [Planctomycetales bacterium]